MGTACNSWTTDPSKIVSIPTQDDLDEEDYMYLQGVGSEANRNGISVATGGSRQSEG